MEQNWRNLLLLLWLCTLVSLPSSLRAECPVTATGVCTPGVEETIVITETESIEYEADGHTVTTTTTTDTTTVTVTNEDSGASVTLDHTGFVSAKVKGDGYHNKPDGVHTVAYQVDSTMAGSIKMQGSLATTPTEDDYFDITGTTFTADQSTLISTANFTGNFVWIRAKATSVTAGTISSILVNS